MSASTLTAVIVTLPTRGSFTSRAISAASTRWISDSMRRLRASLMGLRERARNLDPREALDLIVDAHVLVVLHADTALGAGAHLARVVLEAAQRLERAFEDHDVVAQHADRIVALHQALGHQAPGYDPELRGAEYLAYLRDAHDLLLDLRLQHAGHHLFHVVDGFVDDAVVAHLDAGLLHGIARAGIGAHVETDDESARGRGQLHVRHGDAAQAAGDNLDLHLLGREFGERLGERLRAPLHVGLDEHRHHAGLGLAHLREHILGAGALARELDVAELALAVECHFARLALALGGEELIPGVRRTGQSQHHHRHRGRCFLYRLAVLVEHGAHAPELRAGDDRVADVQRALLDEHGRDRAAPLLDGGLDHHARGETGARRAQLQHLGLQQDRFQQLVDPLTSARRDFHEHVLPAPLLRDHLVLGEIGADAIEVR